MAADPALAERLAAQLAADPTAEARDAEVNQVLARAWRSFYRGDIRRAEAVFRQQATHAEDVPGAPATALLGLALIAHWEGRSAEAADLAEQVCALSPNYATPHYALGEIEWARGNPEAAEAALRRALAIAPSHIDAQIVLGNLALERGAYREGWSLLEARTLRRGYDSWANTFTSYQPWAGEPLDGRTILLPSEQGLGDQLQVARYAPILAARGGRVIVETRPPLARLFRTLAGVEQVITTDEVKARRGPPWRPSVEPIDVWAYPMSLPGVFDTTLETIPPCPYVRADPELVDAWRPRIRPGPALKVGLVWAGNPRSPTPGGRAGWGDSLRHLSLEALAPLGRVPGVTLYSLQVRRRDPAPPGLTVLDLAPWLDDFAETAAAIANLDLVISVDTSVANLVGALGAPGWILLPRPCEWRWLRDGDTTPWYPSLRLFRQERRGEWGPVVERVAAELGKLVAERGAGMRPALGVA